MNGPPPNSTSTSLPIPGTQFEGDLGTGSNAEYSFHIDAGKFTRIVIDSTSSGLFASAFDPEGRQITELYHRQQLSTPVSWTSGSSGAFRLVLRAVAHNSTATARYRFKVETFRNAAPSDEANTEIERVFANAERLRSEWTSTSLRDALESYKDASQKWQTVGATADEAVALKCIGDIHSILGEFNYAMDSFNRALKLSADTKNLKLQLELKNAIASTYIRTAHYREGLRQARLNDKLCETISPGALCKAQSLFNVGSASYFMGNFDNALKALKNSLTLSEHEADLRGQAQALLMMSYVVVDQGDMNQSARFTEQALLLWRAIDDPPGEALALNLKGSHAAYSGDYQTALDFHNQALTIFRKIGGREGEAEAYTGLGFAYFCLADFDKSLFSYGISERFYRENANLNYEAVLLTNIGDVYGAKGDYQKALETYFKALPLIEAAHDTQWHALTLNSIADASLNNARYQDALAFYQKALTLFQLVRNRRLAASSWNGIGSVLEHSGDLREALKNYRHALELSRAVGDQASESIALYNIAKVTSKLGDEAKAADYARNALLSIESLRGKVASGELRASYLASFHKYYELYVDVLMRLHKKQPEATFNFSALEASERGRARSLLEMLKEMGVDIRQGVDQELLKLELSLQQSLNAKAEKQMQLLSSTGNNRAAETLAEEIQHLTMQYDEVQTKIKIASPRYAKITQPAPLNIREIQQVLDADSMLLEYSLGEEQSYLWAVSRTEISSYELPGRKQIEDAARKVYSLLTASQPLLGESFEDRQKRMVQADQYLPHQVAELSKLLLAPVASKLGTKRLLIVADGALQYIPFQVLTVENNGQPASSGTNSATVLVNQPLIANHEIVNEPSASALAVLIAETTGRKRPSKSVAVFADPIFESDDPRVSSRLGGSQLMASQLKQGESERALRDVGLAGDGRIPRLLASQDEARAIMSVAPWRSGFEAVGFAANREAAMNSNLGQYRVVHFATHGLLNDQHPELSGIVLSLFDEKGQPQDGFLRLHDIYNLKLPVDLVVLSACNTGLGKDVKGEGLIGLTRGFMYAGASSVVASLWKVDDEATAELMRLFYGYMLRDGLSPAAALRKAQVTMSQQKRWQSPYYWAGFVIQGQYLQSPGVNRFSTPSLALWLLGAAVVSVTAFYVLKRRRKIKL